MRRQAVPDRVRELLVNVGLSEEFATRLPSSLSGGSANVLRLLARLRQSPIC